MELDAARCGLRAARRRARPRTGAAALPEAAAKPAGGLTARELEVLRLVATGRTNRVDRRRPVPQREDGRPPPQQHLRQAGSVEPGGGDRVRLRARSRLGAYTELPTAGARDWVVRPKRRRRLPRSVATMARRAQRRNAVAPARKPAAMLAGSRSRSDGPAGRRRHRRAGGRRRPAAPPAPRRDRVRRGVLGARDRPACRAPPRDRPRPARPGRVRSGRPTGRRDLRRLVRRAAPGDVPGAAGADRALAGRQPRRALRGRARRAPAQAGDLRRARDRPLPHAARAPRGGGPLRAAPHRAQRGAVRSLGLLRFAQARPAGPGLVRGVQRVHAIRARPSRTSSERCGSSSGPARSGSRTPSCAASRSRPRCCGAGTTASSRSAWPRGERQARLAAARDRRRRPRPPHRAARRVPGRAARSRPSSTRPDHGER